MLKKEESRAHSYYQEKTKEPLIKSIVQELITNHAEELVNKEGTGCAHMLKHSKFEELELMFRLFLLGVDCLKFIAIKLSEYIIQRGDVVVKDEKLRVDPLKFVQELLDLYIEINDIVVKCFHSHEKFQRTRDSAF